MEEKIPFDIDKETRDAQWSNPYNFLHDGSRYWRKKKKKKPGHLPINESQAIALADTVIEKYSHWIN